MKNNDPIFWPPDDVDMTLAEQRKRNYDECINILQTQWYQADLNQRFAMGDQEIWGMLFPGVSTCRRKMFNFNIINPIIQSISGQQRQTRKSTICIPVRPELQKTADQLTKCLYHVHKGSGYQVYSDAFEQGALVQGMGLIHMYNDYSNDPISGDIKIKYLDFKSFLIDPYFRDFYGLSDCRFIHTRQFFDRKEAALCYSKFQDEILSLPRGQYRDDKFYYMPEVYQIQFPNVVAIDEYWYAASREATYIIDIETNETQEFDGDEEDLRDILRKFRNKLRVIKKNRPTVRRQLIVNERVLVDEPNPYGLDCYPHVPTVAYCTPDTPYYAYKFRSVVTDLRDAQYLFNLRKVTDLDILQSQQQGLKVKKGALVTPEDSLNQGNGRVLFIDPKHQMTDVEQMDIHPPSPVMLQMEEMLMNVVYRIAGQDPSAMGIDVDDKAGIISMMRQAASARNLQRLFDQFDECQRLCGDIIVKMIQKSWTFGKVKQVIGEEPSSEFNDKLFFNYGCKVIQGALTESQQQLELAQLLHLQSIAPNEVPIESIIEAMSIQNKDKLIEKITKNKEANQKQQQQMAQLQMQQIEVDNKTKLSYAASEQAKAKENISKIQLDKVEALERLRKSKQEEASSLLDMAKAMKELQGIDINYNDTKVKTLLNLKQFLEEPTQAEIKQEEEIVKL